MQRVLVAGPESSGTRILAELVDQLDDIQAVHRSIPHGWSQNSFEFTAADKAIFITRDWQATALSQLGNGHTQQHSSAIDAIRSATCLFMTWVARTGIPWWNVTYEGLVTRPLVTYREIATFLGVDTVLPADVPIIEDGNVRWIGDVEQAFGTYEKTFHGVG